MPRRRWPAIATVRNTHWPDERIVLLGVAALVKYLLLHIEDETGHLRGVEGGNMSNRSSSVSHFIDRLSGGSADLHQDCRTLAFP